MIGGVSYLLRLFCLDNEEEEKEDDDYEEEEEGEENDVMKMQGIW
jgi:hypothetical protein